MISFLLFAFVFGNIKAQISVTGGTGLAATYTTFTVAGGLFSAINTTAQTGNNIVVTITGNITTETGAVSLNAGAWSTITINPSGARIISGNASGPIINLNGADSVTIDGLNTGGNSLTISNLTVSSTPGTSTIRFINGASNNTITNCKILGSSIPALNNNGGTVFFSTDANTNNGNDNNTISNCDIGPAASNLPLKAIFSSGTTTTAAKRNSGNVISNNNIFDFFSVSSGTGTVGINIFNGNDNWTISNNKIYQTAPRAFSVAGARYTGIILNTTTFPGSFTVTGNRIGFANSAGTGVTTISGSSNLFRGIDANNVDTVNTTNITNNIISGIVQTSSIAVVTLAASVFNGISTGTISPNIGLVNITGNTIGSLDASSSIVLNLSSTTDSTASALGIFSFPYQSSDITGNNIGNITIQGSGTGTGFIGIAVSNNVDRSGIVHDNIISDITDTQIGKYNMYGIFCEYDNASIVNNVIRNMTGDGNGLNSTTMTGINCGRLSTGAHNIEKNKIYNLKNIVTGGGAGQVNGIDVTFRETANEIKQNYIYGLSVSSSPLLTAYRIAGIYRHNGGKGTVYNNMISLGLNADGSSITDGYIIDGIYDEGGGAATGSFNYYYNTIYIGGSPVGASGSNTFSLYSDEVDNVRNFRNNILYNGRSDGTPTVLKHFAIGLTGAGSNPTGLVCNFNDLISTGTDGALGKYNFVNQTTLAAWRSATGKDTNSSSVTVNFVAPASDLHLTGASIGDLNLVATPIPGITTDIDKTTRNTTFPYMGASEHTRNNLMLNVTIGIEGFLDSTLVQVPDNAKIYLRNNVSPYSAVDSSVAYLNSSGNANTIFSSQVNGNYYMQVKHRNALETWSSSAVGFTVNILTNYNFTTSQAQSFGNNTLLKYGRWCFYSGDENQDGTIDVSDIVDIYNDVLSGTFGYVSTDVNGDDFVDVSDVVITYNNSLLIVGVITP